MPANRIAVKGECDIAFLARQEPVWETPAHRMAIDVDYALDPGMPLISPRVAAALALLFEDDRRNDVLLLCSAARAVMAQLYLVAPKDHYGEEGRLIPIEDEFVDEEGTRPTPEPLWSSISLCYVDLPHLMEEYFGTLRLVVACALFDERDAFRIACDSLDKSTISVEDVGGYGESILREAPHTHYLLAFQKLFSDVFNGDPAWLEGLGREVAANGSGLNEFLRFHPSVYEYLKPRLLPPRKKLAPEEEFVDTWHWGSVRHLDTIRRQYGIRVADLRIDHEWMVWQAYSYPKWRYMHSMGFDIVSTTPAGKVPLIEAAVHRNARLLKLLLQLGADPNIVDSGEGCTVVHVLARTGFPYYKVRSMTHHTSMLPVLFKYSKHKVNVDVVDREGNTPLHVATGEEVWSYRSIDALLNQGANPHIKNAAGKYPYELFQDLRKKGRHLCDGLDDVCKEMMRVYHRHAIDPPAIELYCEEDDDDEGDAPPLA